MLRMDAFGRHGNSSLRPPNFTVASCPGRHDLPWHLPILCQTETFLVLCQVRSLKSLFTWWFLKWFFRYPRCYSVGALPKLKQTILQLTCPKSKLLLAHKVREEGSEASNENPMKAQLQQLEKSHRVGVGWLKLQLHLCVKCDCIIRILFPLLKRVDTILHSNGMGNISDINTYTYTYRCLYVFHFFSWFLRWRHEIFPPDFDSLSGLGAMVWCAASAKCWATRVRSLVIRDGKTTISRRIRKKPKKERQHSTLRPSRVGDEGMMMTMMMMMMMLMMMMILAFWRLERW